MKVPFWRYSATGNTFLIFNNRDGSLSSIERSKMANICEEHKVDGLLFLESSSSPKTDFHMRYVNADGGEVEMCGNGARSIIHFASKVANLRPQNGESFLFTTLNSTYSGKDKVNFPLQMVEVGSWDEIDVSDLCESDFTYYMNTGVPHSIFQIEELNTFDVHKHGSKVRYDSRFKEGVNANFFEIVKLGEVNLRTYERGVEAETDSCGTGATAVALSLAREKNWESPIKVNVKGGELYVSFNKDFSIVYLEGAVELLTEGNLEI